MSLNEGLTVILEENPSMRKYHKPSKSKKKKYNNSLKEFGKLIKKLTLIPRNYKINLEDVRLSVKTNTQHISIYNRYYPSHYPKIEYLFNQDGSGVYLSLCVNVSHFKKYDLDMIEKIATNSRNSIETISKKYAKANIDLSKFSENCDLKDHKPLAKKYRAGNIYCKYYEFNKDENIFLPSESELENDLMEFIKLYRYANYGNGNYFDYEQIVRPNKIKTENNLYKSFYDYLLKNGFYFDKETIENYLLSLKVKPFVILTGNSGTGKTKLSQLFAKYLNDKDNYKIIPVGANWTENRHILGYFNIIKNEPQYTPAYYLIKHSQDNQYPHFLILDEMNLSHVERYFADFLSAIESNENIPMHGETELEIPNNLFIIGTVNLDETTYMFSPKVLDRANTIEFKTYPANNYMTNKFDDEAPHGDVKYWEDVLSDPDIQKMSIKDLEKVFDNDEFWNELSNEIFKFQEILKEANFDFGFRVINEITRFMAVAYKYENKPENWTNWKRYFDAQIKQKMLPKLHGSQKLIGETLDKLLVACEDYPTSKAKIIEMQNVLDKQRYVSFIN